MRKILLLLLFVSQIAVGQNFVRFTLTTKEVVAPPTPTYVGKGTMAEGTGNITPTINGSTTAGDYMVLEVETATETVTAPSGWTEITDSPVQYSTTTRLTMFYRRAVGGDSNPTITDPGDHCIAQIFTFRGVSLDAEPFTFIQTSTWAGTTAFNVDCGVTAYNNQLIAIFVAGGADVDDSRFLGVGANASLSSLTQRTSEGTINGNGGSIDLWTGVKSTAGDCGNLTATLSVASAGASMVLSFSGYSYTPPPAVPVISSSPTISGVPTVAETLTANPGTWTSDDTPTYAYQWTKDGVDISGETSSTYVVDVTDDLHYIGVDVIATNSEGASLEASASSVYIITTSGNSSLTFNHVYSGSDRMMIYLPPNYYTSGLTYPVTVFYHGNGKRGSPSDTFKGIGTGNSSTTVFSGGLSNTNRIVHSTAYITDDGAIVATGHFGAFTGTGVSGYYDYTDASNGNYSVTFTTPPATGHVLRIYFTQSNMLDQGVPMFLNDGDEPECIYVIPQISRGSGGFTDTEWAPVLDYLVDNGYRINTDRIYATGLSLGGDMCDRLLSGAESGSGYDWAAMFDVSPGSTAWTPPYNDSDYTAATNKGKLTIKGTSDGASGNKIPSGMANGNASDREFPMQVYNYWGIGHSGSLWDTKGYNRKNRTDATGTADFDYLEEFLFKFSLDDEEQAELFVDYAEATLESEDYRLAKRQVDNLGAGAVKTALLADLVTLKATIGKSVIVDFGSTTTSGNANNITSAAASTTLGSLKDYYDGSNTGFTYTTVAATDASPTMVSDIGSLRVNGRQFGLELNTTKDGMRVDAAGTTGTLQFSGLDNGETYTLKIYVTNSNSAWSNRAEAEATAGGSTKYLYCDTQNFRYIKYTGLAPSSGIVSTTLKSRLTSDTERLFYVQALELIEE